MYGHDKLSNQAKPSTIRMRIIEIIEEIDGIAKTYRFINTDGKKLFNYMPGQSAKLYFDTPLKKNDFRLYSIASPPSRTEYFELMIKSEGGNFAPYFLAEAKEGDTYFIEGPYGRFLSKHLYMTKNKLIDNLVFLASSSGIVPFKCFIEYAIDSSLDVSIYLFYVNRTRNDIIYKRLFPELLSSYKGLNIMFNFTREHQITEREIADQVIINYDDYKDRVSFLFGRRLEFEDIKTRVEKWKEAYYAICGGAKFISGDSNIGELGMTQKLEKNGIERERIEIDSYGTK